jgi:hypothetical protein
VKKPGRSRSIRPAQARLWANSSGMEVMRYFRLRGVRVIAE